MALVKLEIDGRRVTADGSQTILQVARQHGIHTIPTLCDDAQLEPFASCFVCVVKVKGARSLMPACSTKVLNGMVVETNSAEVRQSRKAALELLLSDHYADCVGPCQISCPAGIDIQGYIALAAIGKYKDAIALIKENNPLPSVCGRVCTRPCEVKGCRRTMLDEAVGIDYIKRYVSDLDLNSADVWRPEVAPPNGQEGRGGRRGARAGCRPPTTSRSRGTTVDVLEGQPEPGGMLRYGIPEYRLPKDVLDLEISQILGLGATLQTNAVLGRDFTIASLKQQGYDAIFLGIGAWRSSLMRVQNENAAGVLSGIEFLKNFGLRRPMDISGTVAVVGGGNTAIDCARTALRLGVDEVKAALPPDPRRDAGQRLRDQGRDRGRRQHAVPDRADQGRDRRGRDAEGDRVPALRAGRARRLGPEEPEADPRVRVPRAVRLRHLGDRAEHDGGRPGGREGPRLAAARRGARPSRGGRRCR